MTIGFHIGGSETQSSLSENGSVQIAEAPQVKPEPEPERLETMDAKCSVGDELSLDLKLVESTVGPLEDKAWVFIEHITG